MSGARASQAGNSNIVMADERQRHPSFVKIFSGLLLGW
jgi:hypothetical protein